MHVAFKWVHLNDDALAIGHGVTALRVQFDARRFYDGDL